MALTHTHIWPRLGSVYVVKLSLIHSFRPHDPLFHIYARGGGRGVDLRHIKCVSVGGGHGVTGAGECGDEGVISSLTGSRGKQVGVHK